MGLRSQVLSGLRWLAGAKLASQLFTWSITIVVFRLLTPADYGLLAMATVSVNLLAMMAQFGIGAAVVQAPEVGPQRLRQAFGLVIIVDCVLFLLLFLAARFIAEFFAEPRLLLVTQVMALQFLLMIFAAIPGAQLSRRLQFRTLSVIELGAALAGSITTLTLALYGAGVWALVLGGVIATLWSSIALNVATPFLKWPLFSLAGTRSLLSFGGNVTLSRLLWLTYSQADVVIAGRLLGKDQLGMYSVALHLASLPAQRLNAVVNQVSFPAFARIQADPEKFASHFMLAVRMLSFTAFPALWGLSSIAPEAVPLLLGDRWRPATLPLRLMALAMPTHVVAPFLNTAAEGMGRADLALKQVGQAALLMPLAFLVGSHFGILGLSVAWLVGFPLVLLGNLFIFVPLIGLSVTEVLRAMARPAAAALGMYGFVECARLFLEPHLGDVSRLLVLTLVGLLAYTALALLIDRNGCRDIIGLVKGQPR